MQTHLFGRLKHPGQTRFSDHLLPHLHHWCQVPLSGVSCACFSEHNSSTLRLVCVDPGTVYSLVMMIQHYR